MHILEILNSYPGETFIHEHIRALQLNSGNKTSISLAFTQTSKTGRLKPPFESGPPTFAIPNFDRINKVQKFKYSLRFLEHNPLLLRKKAAIQLVKKVNPDIIHFHFSPAAIQWHWIAEALNIPYTFSIRGSDVHSISHERKEYVRRLREVYERSKGVHSVSEGLKSQFCEILAIDRDNAKITVIRTTVSPQWNNITRNKKKDSVNLIAVGRLHWTKGFQDLLVAVGILKDRGVKLTLSIIGEGSARQELEYMIRNLQIESFVKLEGKKSGKELMGFYESANILVQPSLAEGFPNTLAEAMTVGLPIIASKVGSIPELITSGVNGYLVEAGKPDLLANVIEDAINNPALTENMGLEAKKNADDVFRYAHHSTGFEEFWAHL